MIYKFVYYIKVKRFNYCKKGICNVEFNMIDRIYEDDVY